jgi:succinyl-CoA synthetase alpha subunit
VKVKAVLQERCVTLIGPNGPGVMTPGDGARRGALAGIMPADIHRPGTVGVVSRSGTLTYEAVHQLTRAGLGQSTVAGIGGDAVIGAGFAEVLALFEADPGTEAVLMIGEIGGNEEEDAARFFKTRMRKPLFAYVAGRAAPAGKRMGHAGAVAGEGSDTAEAKRKTLAAAGVRVIDSPADIGDAMARVLRPMARLAP